jgi:hypothetical protein
MNHDFHTLDHGALLSWSVFAIAASIWVHNADAFVQLPVG